MHKTFNILYIHGMGGGGDSRIPSILREYYSDHPLSPGSVDVICRTYDFDPEIAHSQINEWVSEIKPDLVIGESLGALHAMRIKGIPHIFVSPALNAPFYFELLAWLSLIPGVTGYFDRKYRPREGDRQPLHFCHSVLRKYKAHKKAAMSALAEDLACGNFVHAFFGLRDHYRTSGIVSVKGWNRLTGGAHSLYEGTHFMEDEHIPGLLVPLIDKVLINK